MLCRTVLERLTGRTARDPATGCYKYVAVYRCLHVAILSYTEVAEQKSLDLRGDVLVVSCAGRLVGPGLVLVSTYVKLAGNLAPCPLPHGVITAQRLSSPGL